MVNYKIDGPLTSVECLILVFPENDGQLRRRKRYRDFLCCMQKRKPQPIPSNVMTDIEKLATRDHRIERFSEETLVKLKAEITVIYQRTMCVLAVKHKSASGVKPTPCIRMKKTISASILPPQMESVNAATRKANFQKLRDYTKWYSLFVTPEIYTAMRYVVLKCEEISKMTLFSNTQNTHLPMDEFIELQKQTVDHVLKHIKDIWLEDLSQHIRLYLRDIGKGWFDLTTKKYDVFRVSKIFRFLQRIKYHMQTAIRTIIIQSIKLFLNLIVKPCKCCLACPKNFIWGPNLTRTQFKAPSSFLLVKLNINEQGPFTSNNLDSFKDNISELYTRAVIDTHYIPELKPMLMVNLKFAKDLFLNSVGLLDPYVMEGQKKLEMATTAAVVPLNAYLKEFQGYVEFYRLDIKQYVRDYFKLERSVADIELEIQTQLTHKENIDKSIPDFINIGPFHLTMKDFKETYVEKYERLIDALLDGFSKLLNEQVIRICGEYSNIYGKLMEGVDSLEQIREMDRWIDNLGIVVESYDVDVRRIVSEYEIMEKFLVSISNEDFEVQWMALGWPNRIFEQIQITKEMLSEELERFDVSISDDDDDDD